MEIYYDLGKEWRCTADGIRLNGNLPILRYKEKPVWNLHFLKNGAPCGISDFDGAVSFRAAVDVDLNAESDVICRTTDEDIDTDGLSSGILVVPLNANTTGFRIAADGQESRKAFFEVWGIKSNTDPVFYIRFEIRISGVVDSEGGVSPESVVTDAITRTEVMAFLRAPDERQYTSDPADPSSAHTSQSNSDTHTRRRNSAVSGEWGPWETLVRGPQGPAPTLSAGTVTTLSAGSSATAEIVSSGTNAYTLNLGLPKGEDYDPADLLTKANVGLDNITSSGKGVIVDVATELDWDNASAVAAVNTEYTASKSGIVLIRAQRDTSYQLGILVYGPNMDGTDTGSNYIAGAVNEIGSGKAILSTFVPKGSKYMCYLQSGATFLYGKFVPFKNSIANS